MLVTELRGSLTGLDRAVKTYSFLPTDDHIPKILVDSPEGGSPTEILTGSQESGGDSNGTEPKTGDLFRVNGTEKGQSWERNGDGDVDSLGSSMDNFANGILDEFESNLLKWKTQSLPDIYGAVKHFDGSDSSSETSLLSSASESTNSIAESRGSEEKSGLLNDSRISTVASSDHMTTGNHHMITNGRATPDETIRRRQKFPQKHSSDQKTDRHQRFDSIGSTGTFESQSSSLVGSAEGDRDRGIVSASPLPTYPERQYVMNELGVGSVSPVKLRPKRASTGSDQQQRLMRRERERGWGREREGGGEVVEEGWGRGSLSPGDTFLVTLLNAYYKMKTRLGMFDSS